MEDEIKEILDNPKILMLSYGNYISLDDYVKLKDCITNLQESEAYYYGQYKDYKSRNEKAIEYIEKDILNKKIEKVNWDYDDCDYSDMPAERIKPLIDILKVKNNVKDKRVDKAIEIYKNRNTCKYKKERFMEDKSTSDLMYETLTGGHE